MRKILVCMAVVFALTSCCTQRFDVEGYREVEPAYTGKTRFFFWGLGQEEIYNPNEICGYRGVSAVDTYTTFSDGLIGVITLGLYSPKSYSIYCKNGEV